MKTGERLAALPDWRYASFIAALCHDPEKLFELELECGGTARVPSAAAYSDFGHRLIVFNSQLLAQSQAGHRRIGNRVKPPEE